VDAIVVVTTRGPSFPMPEPEPPPPRVIVTALTVVIVAIDVEVTVRVLTTSTVLVNVWPVIPPVEAAAMTLDWMDSAAVTGQTVVVSTMVSVISTVDRASLGRADRAALFAGQLVMVAAHEVTVRTEVVRTVRVVRPAAVPLVAIAAGGLVNVTFPAELLVARSATRVTDGRADTAGVLVSIAVVF
jgi:hypothetical protein